MSRPLLTTKIFTPPPRPNLVPRPDLIQKLNDGLGGKLTLISAPAGFGKTTLLSAWMMEAELPAAWVSLDDGDNDPVRFAAYLVAALQTVCPGISIDGLNLLQSPSFGRTNVAVALEVLLTDVINEINLAAPELPGVAERGFVLILDDYHLITAEPIHKALAFLLDHMPPQMHLVIATRADPPLPIARLRGQGLVNEIRLGDLRFSNDQAKRFLRQSMGLTLTADEISRLNASTEGWIAGLQMAAVSMQRSEKKRDVAAFIQAFTGSNRYVLDYLVEEVIQDQPPEVQEFLSRTSILERLTGPLCDAVIGRKEADTTEQVVVESQTILEMLERANLFLIALDEERKWYRYHRLFADLLQKRLRREGRELVQTLHHRASAWYEQHGYVADAIDHAFAAAEVERAADLVARNADETVKQSQLVTLLGWVDRLPDDLIRAHPSLSFYYAWALLLSGQPLKAVESRLQSWGDDGADHSAPIRALIAFYQGQVSRALELSQQALAQLPDDKSFLRGMAVWIGSIARMAGGDLAASSIALDEVVKTGQESGNLMIAVVALSHLAGLSRRRGRLHEARSIYERALALARDKRGRPLPIAGEALMGLAELWREWNDLEKATRYLEEGIELTHRWGEIAALEGYMTLARIKQAQADRQGAQQAVQEARRLAIQFDAADWDDIMVELLQARLWIARGELEAASRWAAERRLDRGGDRVVIEGGDEFFDFHLRRHEQVVYARLLIAQKRPVEALALLDPLLPLLQAQGRVMNVIELQALRALAFQEQEDSDRAMGALEEALSLAEPGGCIRVFLDEGEAMARLLYQAAERGIASHYTGRLLAQLVDAESAATEADKMPPVQPAPPIPEPLIEPLSERELEVLHLIAEGLSNREISQKLFVTLSTVKAHTYNLYGKLGVHSRTQAVSRAQALGLISPGQS